jgi:hypothetical protein
MISKQVVAFVGLSMVACSSRSTEPARPISRELRDMTAMTRERPYVQTGAPLPERATHDLNCPGGTRWLSERPHVPLAVTRERKIIGIDSACCLAFGGRGSKWQGLDAWGRKTGLFEVVGGIGNEPSQCYWLELRNLSAGAPSALYVSGAWTQPESFEWRPAAAERASLSREIANADRRFPALDGDAPLTVRERYFRIPSASGHGDAHLVVVGGTVLFVFALGSDATWTVVHSDETLFRERFKLASAYSPTAVLDMNVDGSPEIVVTESGGESFCDVILERNGTGTWKRMAESIGGSTL